MDVNSAILGSLIRRFLFAVCFQTRRLAEVPTISLLFSLLPVSHGTHLPLAYLVNINTQEIKETTREDVFEEEEEEEEIC